MSNDTQERVVDCLANVTRYPRKLLTVEADLENDLGIDSVKRVEIVLALSAEFGLELQAEQRDPSIRTIGDVVGWIKRCLNRSEIGRETGEIDRRREAPTNGRTRSHVSHTRPQPAPRPHYAVGDRAAEPINQGQSLSQGQPLSGRVALITGSGRGVGRTIARLLASRGASVVVNSFHSRNQGEQTVNEIVAQGGSAVHIWGSVANDEHVERMFDEIEQQFGRLDVLVCNASDGRIGSFSELTSDDWDRAFRTNVSGHYHCAMRAAELMRPRGGGSIVTMSAVGAHQFISGLGSQGVVKAAVEALTRYLACELGRYGIRVNCVVGGPVYGDLLDKFPEAEMRQQHWESMIPDGELTTPVDLAETINFLISDRARAINGAVWMVDHGFSANADGQPLNNGFQNAAFEESYQRYGQAYDKHRG